VCMKKLVVHVFSNVAEYVMFCLFLLYSDMGVDLHQKVGGGKIGKLLV